MSQKIVTDALQSPSLAGELKDYHKSMVNDIAKRGVLVVLSGILLLLQYAVIIMPSSSTNTSSVDSDIIHGGVSSKQDALLQYDNKDSTFHSALDALSLSRNDVSNTKETSMYKWVSGQQGLVVSWSRSPIYKVVPSANQSVNNSSFVATNDGSLLYHGSATDNQALNKSDIGILAGRSETVGNFAIVKSSGDILTTSSQADKCYKKPNDSFSYFNCPNSNTFTSKTTVTNLSYKTDARYIKNHPSDRLMYEIKVTNNGQSDILLRPEIYVGDILEYSNLTSVDSAKFDKESKILQWPLVSIIPGEQKTYSFTIQILDTIPITAYGQTNASSNDCYMSSFVGGQTDIKVSCPTTKIVERMLSAPVDSSFIAIAWLIFIINILIYIKVRISSKEHELILKSIRSKHV
ncbi:MAG: hypothetical protein Q7T74_07370 [Candidatus Saccharibacteria bacterium]|nr:hypothetical protein [Candidatus Saccharibacteria bacterium]